MFRQLNITPEDEILIHQCKTGQYTGKFTCETCPHQIKCTTFMHNYEAVPIQVVYSNTRRKYIAR